MLEGSFEIELITSFVLLPENELEIERGLRGFDFALIMDTCVGRSLHYVFYLFMS
jgi:hypothetical protein